MLDCTVQKLCQKRRIDRKSVSLRQLGHPSYGTGAMRLLLFIVVVAVVVACCDKIVMYAEVYTTPYNTIQYSIDCRGKYCSATSPHLGIAKNDRLPRRKSGQKNTSFDFGSFSWRVDHGSAFRLTPITLLKEC